MSHSSGSYDEMRGTHILSLLFALSLTVGCSQVDSLDAAPSGAGCGPDGCFNSDAASDAGSSDVSTDIGTDAVSESGSAVNPLCGVLNCDPDDDRASKCNSTTSDGGTEDAGDADTDGDAAASVPDAELDGDADVEADVDGSSMGGSMGGSKQPSDDSNLKPSPDDAPADDGDAPAFACQVTLTTTGDPEAMCVPGGEGVDNDPCVTSADCSAGYACVGKKNAGVCRSYCCLDPEACAKGTYCGVLPSRDSSDDDAEFMLPVCIPARDCELLPGPGGINRCEEGLMCAIVRSDGTTACVLPGDAAEGESCEVVGSGQSPCAEGYVCSKATNSCLALCEVSQPDACGEGVCQGGTDGIPEGYGICVGAGD